MRLAFIQSYPIYHDMWTTDSWLSLENRDRWMPGLASMLGHEVELWAVDKKNSTHLSVISNFGDYTIRLFEPDNPKSNSKRHWSTKILDHATRFNPEFCFLKGIDGGTAVHLIENYLLPMGKDYAFIIGGKYYTRRVPSAKFVFFETDYQKHRLMNPGPLFWRHRIPNDRLIYLPKSIDTDLFRPAENVNIEWDIISVARLLPRLKNFKVLAKLSEKLKVAVVGGGPGQQSLREEYPRIEWLGQKPYKTIPQFLNKARLFMHTGLREYFPRVLAEAAACGLPRLAFRKSISPDIIPDNTGILLDLKDYMSTVLDLLDNQGRMKRMSEAGRRMALEKWGSHSSVEALETIFRKLGKGS